MRKIQSALRRIAAKWPVLLLMLFLAVMISLLRRQVEHPEAEYDPEEAVSIRIPDADLAEIYPQACSMQMKDSLYGELYGRFGQQTGFVLYSGQTVTQVYGYGGPTPLFLICDNAGIVRGLYLEKNHETPSYLRRLKRTGFLDTWTGKSFKELPDIVPDAVSGCTYSSEAIGKTVRQMVAAYTSAGSIQPAIRDFSFWIRTVLSCAVIVLALIFFFYPAAMRPYRVWLYALNVLILGFWNGEMLSTDLFYGWLTRGISVAAWFLFALFLISVILPLVTGRAFYCTCVCPYGAAQELMGRLHRKKYRLPAAWTGILKYIPRVLLLGCVGAALVGLADNFVQVEVFSGFGLRSASVWVLICFGFFLAISPFVARPWCRYFCPTGYLLELFRKPGRIPAAKKPAKKPADSPAKETAASDVK